MNTLQPLGGYRAASGLSKGSSSSPHSGADIKHHMHSLPATIDDCGMLETLKDASTSINTVSCSHIRTLQCHRQFLAVTKHDAISEAAVVFGRLHCCANRHLTVPSKHLNLLLLCCLCCCLAAV
jgi:hypothetical protein